MLECNTWIRPLGIMIDRIQDITNIVILIYFKINSKSNIRIWTWKINSKEKSHTGSCGKSNKKVHKNSKGYRENNHMGHF